MADPVTALPEELRAPEPPREGALALLERHDFRRLYLAVSASELGNAFHYIALMWFALVAGGPLGVLAVRLADTVPALLFGIHGGLADGGLAADRWNRKRMLVGVDLARAAVLVPVAAAGIGGQLPLWGLVVAAFALETATSYFQPAYGALVPALVGRRNVQAATSLVQATANALSIGGWAIAAGHVAVLPISAFFALNPGSFLVSAAGLLFVAPLFAVVAPRSVFPAAALALRLSASSVRPLLAGCSVHEGRAPHPRVPAGRLRRRRRARRVPGARAVAPARRRGPLLRRRP